jgi:hypothetical protein
LCIRLGEVAKALATTLEHSSPCISNNHQKM